MSFARLLIAPSLASSTLLYLTHSPTATHNLHRTTLLCEASPSIRARTDPLIDPHQFATGSVLGIAAGLIFKRLGKFFFLIIGGSYLLLRALGTSPIPGLNQIGVSWSQARRFQLNRTSMGDKAAASAGEVTQNPIVTFLTRDVTFKASFLATFMIGLVNT